MLRHLTALMLAGTIAAAANAAPFKDPKGRFDLTIPSGWTTEKLEDGATFEIAHESTDAAPFYALCNGSYDETEDTRSDTQTQINETVDRQIDREFWNRVIGSTEGKYRKTIDDSGSRSSSGRSVHYVVFTSKQADDPADVGVKGRMEVHFVPGSMHLVLCMAHVNDYAAAGTDLTTVFTSYAPRTSGGIISSNEKNPPSVLTMFANANFRGAARVLSSNTPNLAKAGWPTLSASLTVDGAEPWQVCDGVGFTGRCRTIVAADAGDGRAIQVGSARRLDRPNAANILATETRRIIHRAQIQINR